MCGPMVLSPLLKTLKIMFNINISVFVFGCLLFVIITDSVLSGTGSTIATFVEKAHLFFSSEYY